jgi:transmembrane sensor
LKEGNDNREANVIRRQASEWLVLTESDDATVADRKRFEEWLREAPGHRRAFTELERTWGRLTALGGRAAVRGDTGAEPDPDVVLKHVDRMGRERRRPRAAWAAAAALMAAAVFATLLYFPTESQMMYRTGVGERQTVPLADGSTVDLNTDSELLVKYTNDLRVVDLRRGEAFFKVALDEGRPFMVSAGHGMVHAIGTAFTVRLKSSELVAVTVSEGIVEVTQLALDHAGGASRPAGKPAATLHQGQRAEYDRRATRIQTIAPQDLEREQAWRKGLLMFENESLANVLEEVNRYTTTPLVLADAELGKLRLGGTFRAGRVEALLNVLEKAFGIRVERENPHTVMLHAPSVPPPHYPP